MKIDLTNGERNTLVRLLIVETKAHPERENAKTVLGKLAKPIDNPVPASWPEHESNPTTE